jgi:hypothetical protein
MMTVQQQSAGCVLAREHGHRFDRRADEVARQVHVVHAVVQVERRVVGRAREVGGGRHVLAEEADHRAERGRPGDVVGDAVGGGKALHEADADGAAGRARGVGYRARIGSIRAAGLLHEDVQAALQRSDGQIAVLHRADGHAGNIDPWQRQQFAEFSGDVLHAVAACHHLGAAAVEVADTGEFDVVPQQLRQQHLFGVAAAAGPDDAAGHAGRRLALSCSRFLMKAQAAASSACSSCAGGFHCAKGMPMRSSSRRNGSRQIAPA